MPRYNERIMTAIHGAYIDKVPQEQRDNVLYIGPFIDGLTIYLRELLQVGFPANPDNEPSLRRHMQQLLRDTQPGMRGRHFLVQNLELLMQRPSWQLNNRGELPKVVVWNRMVEVEPGELMNSPVEEYDAEEGVTRLVERKGEKIVKDPFVPKIREDKRYGLHYLLRGDRFDISYNTRRGEHISMRYELRPPHEGSSLITPERQIDNVVW